jgi:hypothetical protein
MSLLIGESTMAARRKQYDEDVESTPMTPKALGRKSMKINTFSTENL